MAQSAEGTEAIRARIEEMKMRKIDNTAMLEKMDLEHKGRLAQTRQKLDTDYGVQEQALKTDEKVALATEKEAAAAAGKPAFVPAANIPGGKSAGAATGSGTPTQPMGRDNDQPQPAKVSKDTTVTNTPSDQPGMTNRVSTTERTSTAPDVQGGLLTQFLPGGKGKVSKSTSVTSEMVKTPGWVERMANEASTVMEANYGNPEFSVEAYGDKMRQLLGEGAQTEEAITRMEAVASKRERDLEIASFKEASAMSESLVGVAGGERAPLDELRKMIDFRNRGDYEKAAAIRQGLMSRGAITAESEQKGADARQELAQLKLDDYKQDKADLQNAIEGNASLRSKLINQGGMISIGKHAFDRVMRRESAITNGVHADLGVALEHQEIQRQRERGDVLAKGYANSSLTVGSDGEAALRTNWDTEAWDEANEYRIVTENKYRTVKRAEGVAGVEGSWWQGTDATVGAVYEPEFVDTTDEDIRDFTLLIDEEWANDPVNRGRRNSILEKGLERDIFRQTGDKGFAFTSTVDSGSDNSNVVRAIQNKMTYLAGKNSEERAQNVVDDINRKILFNQAKYDALQRDPTLQLEVDGEETGRRMRHSFDEMVAAGAVEVAKDINVGLKGGLAQKTGAILSLIPGIESVPAIAKGFFGSEDDRTVPTPTASVSREPVETPQRLIDAARAASEQRTMPVPGAR